MIEYTGKVKKVLFKKDDFMIAILETDVAELKFTGNFYGIEKDESLTIKGEIVNHPKYGEQLQVKEWERPMPETKDQVISFLSSGLIKGCGEKRAKDIVRKLGDNAIKIINIEGKDALLGIKGIGKKSRNEIVESIKATFEVQEIIQELLVYGISAEMSLKLYKVYQDDTARVVRKNPYTLTELDNVGFLKADEIAKKMGILPTSSNRINACITYVLNQICYSNGHTFVNEDELVNNTLIALNHNSPPEQQVMEQEIKQSIYQLEEQTLIIEDGQVYPKHYYKYEDELARKLSNLRSQRGGGAMPSLDNQIKEYQKNNQIILADNQRKAIKMLMQEQIFVLTGGPGTGKTTVVKAMLEVYRKQNSKGIVRLAAPTGRASRKLQETTGYEATTIHRLIGFKQGELPDFHDKNRLSADLVIIDEFSMVDLQLAYWLINALENDTKVLFIGDVDQLPSVGSGNVLRDIINSKLPTIRLTEVFRQAQQSQIVTNAHRINNGNSLLIDNDKEDFYFIQNYNDSHIAELIIKSALRFQKLGYKIKDMLILSPMKKGNAGTLNLNERLRDKLNPKHSTKIEIEVGKRLFREGDKVMQKVNNREKNVYNGELGIINTITKKKDEKSGKMTDVLYCDFDGQSIEYERSELNELELGYALTIHKSQGGEAPIVIMPVTHTHYRMLARNLYYTGVTRAKEKVVLIGSDQAMNIAIQNNQVSQRNSKLDKRIIRNNEYIDRLQEKNVEHS